MGILRLGNSIITIGGSALSLGVSTPPPETINIYINASWCAAEGCLCGQVQLKCCTGTCLCGKSISTNTTTLTSFTNISIGCYYVDFNNVVGLDGSMQIVTTYGSWSDCYNSYIEGKCTCSFASDNNITYDLYDAIF